MSALPPKADINGYDAGCLLLTQSGHSTEVRQLSSESHSLKKISPIFPLGAYLETAMIF